MAEFSDTQPIYLQIRQRLIEMILAGRLGDDRALPSVRQIATDLSVNPLTVSRAYQSLVDLGVVETRRGLGMFATDNAAEVLLGHERQKFLTEDWPRIARQIEALGLSAADLLSKKDSK